MPESLQLLTVDGLISVYGAGFALTFACWAFGAKIGIAIQVIRKL